MRNIFNLVRSFVGANMLYIKLGLIALVVMFCFSGGWYLRGVFFDAARSRELDQAIIEKNLVEKKYNEISEKFDNKISEYEISTEQLNKDLSDARKTNPDFNCRVPAAGLRFINSFDRN